MSSISYFQRYSQKENHVTNNTLLMLRHVYRYSPPKLSVLLNALLQEEMPIGLQFQQQIHGTHSVADALVIQQPLSVFVEAKLGDVLNEKQIEAHIESITNLALPKGSVVLIGLTKQQLATSDADRLKKSAGTNGIRFFGVTYSDLASELRKLCADYEQDLLEIVEDYQAFLSAEKLLSNPWMVVFPCGTSWRDNVNYGIYYERSTRSGKWGGGFLGIYHDKVVTHIGQIAAVAVCQIKDGKLVEEAREFGTLTEDQRNRIKKMIDSTSYYDLKDESCRYYVVDRFVATHFSKASPGGVRGHRYFDLSEYSDGLKIDSDSFAAALATALNEKTFF